MLHSPKLPQSLVLTQSLWRPGCSNKMEGQLGQKLQLVLLWTQFMIATSVFGFPFGTKSTRVLISKGLAIILTDL